MFDSPTKLFNRNFTLQWIGQSISRLGNQAFLVSMILYIKETTGSATLVGLLPFLSMVPGVILSPIGGAVADRQSRKKIIILTDLIRGLAVLGLALIIQMQVAEELTLIAIFSTSLIISVVTTFFSPAIQSTTPSLVPADKVTAANSLGQLSVQTAVFFGQGFGAVLYRLLGVVQVFLINGFSYLLAVVLEIFVRIPQVLPEKSKDWRERGREFTQDIRYGYLYVWNQRGLRVTVLISAVLSFFTAPVTILLPFFVEETLNVKIDWYGFIIAASGVGTMVGYLLASLLRVSAQRRITVLSIFIILNGAGYLLIGFVRSPILVLLLGFWGGMAVGLITVTITTLIQLSTPDQMRGRIFGVLAMISSSLAPIAMVLSGVVADLVDQNIPVIYISCGAILLILTTLSVLNRDFRAFVSQDLTENQDQTTPINPNQALPG